MLDGLIHACRRLTRNKEMKNIFKVAKSKFVLICLFVCGSASAQTSLGIGTWNLAWLMDKATHDRWVKGCTAINWQTEDELRAAGKKLPSDLEGLPYCDVHDGIDFRKKVACYAAMGPGARSRPNDLNSPDGKCRVSPDLAKPENYDLKIKTLRETFAAMDKDGVTLVGLQEVTNEDAVRQILPAGWDVKTSASVKGAPKIPQHVGLAWKSAAHSPTNFDLVDQLSAIGRRPLRPGLQFRVNLGNQAVDGLVVHLKAGCRSSALDKPKSKSEQDACPILAQQVPVVESWIDTRVGKDFMILGDFNRSLLKELESFPQPDPKQFGTNKVENIQWIAPEWNDDQPKGSLVTVVPHKKKADGSLIAGDFFCAQTTGIDHVIVSETLRIRVQPKDQALEMLPVSYRLNGKRLPTDNKTVPPSDHCARFVRLAL